MKEFCLFEKAINVIIKSSREFKFTQIHITLIPNCNVLTFSLTRKPKPNIFENYRISGIIYNYAQNLCFEKDAHLVFGQRISTIAFVDFVFT